MKICNWCHRQHELSTPLCGECGQVQKAYEAARSQLERYRLEYRRQETMVQMAHQAVEAQQLIVDGWKDKIGAQQMKANVSARNAC